MFVMTHMSKSSNYHANTCEVYADTQNTVPNIILSVSKGCSNVSKVSMVEIWQCSHRRYARDWAASFKAKDSRARFDREHLSIPFFLFPTFLHYFLLSFLFSLLSSLSLPSSHLTPCFPLPCTLYPRTYFFLFPLVTGATRSGRRGSLSGGIWHLERVPC